MKMKKEMSYVETTEFSPAEGKTVGRRSLGIPEVRCT